MYQNLNPPPFKDPVDQGSRGGLMPTWHAWFSQLFKWLQSLGNSVSNLVSNYNTAVVWDGVNDRVLGVGQITQDSFSAQTSIPLHIACGDGQEYEIDINGSYTLAAAGANPLLLINNTTLAGNFTYHIIQQYDSTANGNIGTAAYTGFLLTVSGSSIRHATVKVFTSSANKATESVHLAANNLHTFSGVLNMECADTTTVWSSVGTITLPNAWTGQIVVRRVA